MNMSDKYRNITPIVYHKKDEDDHLNFPFYYLENAKGEICQKYDKLNETAKKEIGKYEYQIHADDGNTPENISKPLRCVFDKDGDTSFKLQDEDMALYMDVVNPKYSYR
jgi:hypothetical protein